MITLHEVSQVLNELKLKTDDGTQLEFNSRNLEEVIDYSIGDNQYKMYITTMVGGSIQVSLIDAPLSPIESCKLCRTLSCLFEGKVVVTCKDTIVSGF